jgi:oleandomycin transport system ATP-binding protein
VIDHGQVIAHGTADQLKARVGGQILEVRPADPNDLDRTGAILASLTGACCPIDRDARLAAVPITDPAWLPVAVRRLDEAGIAQADHALRRPSLDEVFLALTGQPAEPVTAPAPAPEVERSVA